MAMSKAKQEQARTDAQNIKAQDGEQVEAPDTETPTKGISPEVFIKPGELTDEQIVTMQKKLFELEAVKAEKRTAHVNLILRPSRLNRFKTLAKQRKQSNSALFEYLIDKEWELDKNNTKD